MHSFVMLKRSFVHIPGIGTTMEKKLWAKGIFNWEHLQEKAPSLFKEPKLRLVTNLLKESELAYKNTDLFYFYKNLPREQLWRLVPEGLDKIAYLDIETTGLGFPPFSHSTTITFYLQGQLYQEYEYGKKKLLIKKMLKECSMLATFFGEVFDVPFLKREFDLEMNKAHLDLCFWLKRHQFGGGLKTVQKRFSDIPDRDSMDINGFDAVKLWHMHGKGVEGALETLLTYNAEDTIVLEPLLVKAFNMEVEKHPYLQLEKLKPPKMPSLKTKISSNVYALLKGLN